MDGLKENMISNPVNKTSNNEEDILKELGEREKKNMMLFGFWS